MASNLIKTLHEWWEATDALTALVPVERVASEVDQANEETEEDEDGDDFFDDCVVLQVTNEPHWKTNSGRGYKGQVKVQCLSVSQERSRLIAEAVETAWTDSNYTGSEALVTLSRYRSTATTQDDETGIWENTVIFDMNNQDI